MSNLGPTVLLRLDSATEADRCRQLLMADPTWPGLVLAENGAAAPPPPEAASR
ncbi:MAG: hypothetical protein HC922_02070 [Leptolyngbyaceae cyanobacterium SM2_3_12]|nr:hypothetical protein [Leptolyngbyaceae cyanobacterium SM2_3_12]